ncbi:unnamed protein product [Rangifer tarandus platyrhynchus]|uniref:Secreted protein n=1 Tax=Rangifer tarandus platyrhynchus TaxID=3082113 RepID=A0ABN8YJ11_RANTA|nr:unnamed protein product [Rangifer tarandus platyrhynchus]
MKTTNSVQSTIGTCFVLFSAYVNSLSSKIASTPKRTQIPLSRLPTGTQGPTISTAHPLGRQCLSCIPLSPGAQVFKQEQDPKVLAPHSLPCTCLTSVCGKL